MARPSHELVRALRATAARLRSDRRYHWGHMGNCNCGHLACAVTGAEPAAVHRAALEREGDWATQAREYCPTSGLEIDDLMARLFELGLNPSDLRHLEWLTDPAVVRALPAELGKLKRSSREHVIAYLETWASQLEADVPRREPAAPVVPELDVALTSTRR